MEILIDIPTRRSIAKDRTNSKSHVEISAREGRRGSNAKLCSPSLTRPSSPTHHSSRETGLVHSAISVGIFTVMYTSSLSHSAAHRVHAGRTACQPVHIPLPLSSLNRVLKHPSTRAFTTTSRAPEPRAWLERHGLTIVACRGLVQCKASQYSA